MEKYKRALRDTENLLQKSQKWWRWQITWYLGSLQGLVRCRRHFGEGQHNVFQKKKLKMIFIWRTFKRAPWWLKSIFRKCSWSRAYSSWTSYSPDWATFDPCRHEALFHMLVDRKELGTVMLVNKVGYKLHGHTPRPTLVSRVKEI